MTTATAVDLTTWTGGPLPQDLEQIAFKIFLREYSERLWYDPLMSPQRNDARRFALQLRVDFIKLDRWDIEAAHQQLAERLQALIFGDRRLGKSIRQEIADYAETVISDAWGHFTKRLFYPKQVEANLRELDAEGK